MNMAASRSRNTIVDFVTEPRSMTLFSPTTTPQQHDVRVLPRVAKVIENTPRAPWVDAAEAKHEFGLRLCEPSEGECDAIVVAVGHDEFRKMDAEGIRAYIKPGAVMYEVKYVLLSNAVDGRLKSVFARHESDLRL